MIAIDESREVRELLIDRINIRQYSQGSFDIITVKATEPGESIPERDILLNVEVISQIDRRYACDENLLDHQVPNRPLHGSIEPLKESRRVTCNPVGSVRIDI